ncbi:MAG: zinc-binding dehydrogenase [Candidatus Caldarchaeum sp.]|uniref:Enoyl reductase (ER) domain-containing protein n=1 Tax=Caldiarchaeum subterraneum TaxID=311458 RepID=A0A7C5QDB2_CALS0
MKAAVMYRAFDLRLEEIPEPEPGPGTMLVRVKACGVCPVDIRVFNGEDVWVSLPAAGVSGHEIAGVVEKVGEGVFTHKPGDRVAGSLHKPCGLCKYCLTESDNLCSNSGLYKPPVFGFAEYVLAYPDKMPVFGESLSFEEAAFTEPLAACVNAVEKCGIKPGDWVAVVGVGQIGLMHVQLAKLKGARVVAIDLLDERLRLAEKLGADYAVNSSDKNAVEQCRLLTKDDGFDKVITSVGGDDAIRFGLSLLAKKGIMNIFASTHPKTEISIDPNTIHYKEIIITGTYGGTKKDFKTALTLIQQGVVKVKPLITHRLPLERIVEGFQLHSQRKSIKVIITP